MLKYRLIISLITALFISLPTISYAALENPLGETDIRVIIGRVISALLGFSGALALLMFVWGGITWLTSGGNETRIKKGKDTLLWATIGLVVIFTSYAIVRAIVTALTTGSI